VSDDVLSTFSLGDYKAEVLADYSGATESPRDYDGNIGVLAMKHDRYDLGDPENVDEVREVYDAMGRVLDNPRTRRTRGSADKIVARWIKLRFGSRHVVAVGLGDHSGLWTYLGGGEHWTDPGGWDSGTVGFYFDTPDRVAGFYAEGKEPTDAEVKDVMVAQHHTYDRWLRGEVYIVHTYKEVTCDLGHTHADEEDYLGGYIGSEHADETAKEQLLYAASTYGTLPFLVDDGEGKQMPYRYTSTEAHEQRSQGVSLVLDFSGITES
jgi:hypothetical protein